MSGGRDTITTVDEAATQLQAHSDRLQTLEESVENLTSEFSSLSAVMIDVKESLSTIALLCQRFGIPTNSLPIPEASSNQESNAIGGELIHKSEKKFESVLGVIKAKEIEEELLIEEIAIDSFSRDSPIPSEAAQSLDLEVIIPSYLFEEEDVDSLDELIPSFLFDEARKYSITTVVYTMATRSVSSQFQEIGKSCFSVLPDYSRLLFDRGKDFKLIQSFSCFAGISEFSLDTPTLCSFPLYACYSLMANYNDLIHQLGYQLDWSFGEAIVGLLAECGFPRTAGPLFDKIPGSAVWNLWGVRIDYLLQLKLCSVFDQRKEIELSSRNFSFTKYPEIVSHLDMLLKLLDEYYGVFVPELSHENGYWSDSCHHGVFSATWQMFPIDIVCLHSNNVLTDPFSSEKSLYDGRVFDRGKQFGIITGYTYPTVDYEFSLDFTGFCLFSLDVYSIVKDENNRNFFYKPFFKQGLQLHTFCIKDIFLVFRTGGIADVFLRCLQVRMRRKVFLILQLKCGLIHEISVPLVVIHIHMESSDCFSEFRILLWIHTDQGNWIVQIASAWFTNIARTCEIVGQVSTHMIQVVSSAGDFVSKHLIFLLTLRLGFRSDFPAMHLLFILHVLDADIVDERKLTVRIVVRHWILSHLAENLVKRLNSGDARTFILAEWLEDSASEQEHKQWLPKTVYFCGSASNTKVAYTWNKSFIRSLRTQVMLLVFRFRYMWMVVDLFRWKSTLCSIGFWTVKTITLVDVDFASPVYLVASWFLRPSPLQETKAYQHITAVYGRFSTQEPVAHYVEKQYNTRHQNFNVTYYYVLRTQIPSFGIDFSKVYFFQYLFLLTSRCTSLHTAVCIRLIFDRGKELEPVGMCSVFDRHMCVFYLTSCLIASNGLNFMDPCDGIYAHEIILDFEYHFTLWFGISHVFEFVLNGDRCDASHLVIEMPWQDCVLWFILILQMARKKEVDSKTELFSQLLLRVTNISHLMLFYKHHLFSWFHTAIYSFLVVIFLAVCMEDSRPVLTAIFLKMYLPKRRGCP